MGFRWQATVGDNNFVPLSGETASGRADGFCQLSTTWTPNTPSLGIEVSFDTWELAGLRREASCSAVVDVTTPTPTGEREARSFRKQLRCAIMSAHCPVCS